MHWGYFFKTPKNCIIPCQLHVFWGDTTVCNPHFCVKYQLSGHGAFSVRRLTLSRLSSHSKEAFWSFAYLQPNLFFAHDSLLKLPLLTLEGLLHFPTKYAFRHIPLNLRVSLWLFLRSSNTKFLFYRRMK